MDKRKSILIFGGGELQLSLIRECKKKGLYTVIIDPNAFAKGQHFGDAFEVVDGQDYKNTCSVIERYNIKAIITAATDKPLIMMAQVAEKYKFPFFSVDTAIISTDKFQMKKCFQHHQIPCAQGNLVRKAKEILSFPVIVKPRDNSGSRGVLYCSTLQEAQIGIADAFLCTKQSDVLVEEVIDGKEYSIEAIHYNGKTKVIQFTEKITSPFPYNVELGHLQPADLDKKIREEISGMIEKIAITLGFNNCASHTELKINSGGIFIIETSPRLGGDFITSTLTPLSTGVNIENALIDISLGLTPTISAQFEESSGILFFNFSAGNKISYINKEKLGNDPNIYSFLINLEIGSLIPEIKSSLDRYGYIILKAKDRQALLEKIKQTDKDIQENIRTIKY